MELNKYSFSWKDFEGARHKRFKHLKEDSHLSDVTLVCDNDKQIKAHKIILSSFSTLFRKMFVNNPHPQPLVFLKGIDLVDLNAIVDFIYTGEASVDQDNFNSFLETAVDLEIEELSSFSSESAKSEIRLGFLQNQDNVEKIEKDVQSKCE